jgi:hypothetical protein
LLLLKFCEFDFPVDNDSTGETAVATALEAGLITRNAFAITVAGTYRKSPGLRSRFLVRSPPYRRL